MGSVLYYFTFRRTWRGALIWAFIFGASIAATAIGYSGLDPGARATLAATFSTNTGVMVLIGVPYHLEIVSGFTAWRTMGLLAPMATIWGLLTATRYFRGEEESGRGEFFLAGQTTPRRSAMQTLAALAAGLGLFTVITATGIWLGGRGQDSGFDLEGSVIFAITLALLAATFMAIGFFTSQLAATRRQAAAMAGVVFALFFAMRAIGSVVTDARWLLDITPFGWAQHVHPLTDNNWPWLLPLVGLTSLLVAAGLWVVGRRDMGASLIADHDTAPAHTTLLHNVWTAALRLNRGALLGWTLAFAFAGLIFGNFAKPAGTILNSSDALQHITGELGAAGTQAAAAFMGIGFFMCGVLVMVMVVGLLNALREDESSGYLDNFLVQPVRRWTLFVGRGGLVVFGLILTALMAGLTCVIASRMQQTGVDWWQIVRAALFAAAPAFFLLGLGMLLLGFRPRLMTGVLYGYIGWSFLMEMIGTLLNFNHLLLNTSILHHMALLPAAEPRWATTGLMLGVAVVMAAAGIARLNYRDIETD